VLLALYEGALSTGWGRALFVGLVLGALGDVFLIPRNKGTFLLGLVSFLLGHLAYAIAFAMRGLDRTWTFLGALFLVIVAIPVVRWLWPHVEERMRMPVAAYVAVITTMVTLAIGTFAAHRSELLLIGAVSFYFSDLAVARERFVARGFINRAWGLPLYYGAQLVLAIAARGP
jgi:uncharacterized membrane protein YhhN